MALSNRTKEIIRLILNQKGYITVEELAKRMDLSQRTIYRELTEVASVMKEYGVTLVSASKKGVAASGSTEAVKRLQDFLGGLNDVMIVNPDERMDYILLYLLHQDDYVKMEAIAIDHQCALSTIRNDLSKAKQLVVKYDLNLIQQKGQGVKITGTRMEKNHLITDILLRWADGTLIYHWLEGENLEFNSFLNRMEEYGFRKIMTQTHSCLKGVLLQNSRLMKTLKTREYLEIIFLTSFLIYSHDHAQKYRQYLEASLEDAQELELYRRIRKSVQESFSVNFTEKELLYLQWVIHVSIGKSVDQITTVKNKILNSHILDFITYVEQRMGIAFSGDRELKDSLYIHMDKALLRIRSNMQIENTALSEIRENYGEIFDLVQYGVRICFPNDYFPDEEIGYLVLYFALALDKMTKRIFKVLVVCSGGMGSSKMLASALEREIPEITVVKTLSVVALEKENLKDYDLILSTIPLYINDEYLHISPMLYKNEVQLIREKIRRHKYGLLRRIDETEKKHELYQNGNHEKILAQVADICQMSLKIITGFRFVHCREKMELRNDGMRLLQSYRYFREEGLVPRIEKISQFLIPMTSIMYYEGECRELLYPAVFVQVYDTGAEESEGSSFHSAVMVFYSKELKQHEKKALFSMVEAMLQEEKLLRAIEQKDADEVKYWLGLRMRDYVDRLLQE